MKSPDSCYAWGQVRSMLGERGTPGVPEQCTHIVSDVICVIRINTGGDHAEHLL